MRSKSLLKYALAIVLTAFPIMGYAQQRQTFLHFEYGLDWGVTANMFYHYHVNYTAAETGARVNTEQDQLVMNVNGQMMAYMGTELGQKWSTEILCGLTGLYDGTTSVPLTMRFSYFPSKRKHRSLKLFAEAGSAFAPNFNNQTPLLVKAGAGTRIQLARRVSLDFMAALQMYMCHPEQIWDGINKTQVYSDMMRKCDAIYAGINISMSLNFR